MQLSHSEKTPVRCSNGHEFIETVWSIACPEGDERLALALQKGRVNRVTCPSCGEIREFPLLLIQLSEIPGLLLVRPHDASPTLMDEAFVEGMQSLSGRLTDAEMATLQELPTVGFPPLIIPYDDVPLFVDRQGRRPRTTALRAADSLLRQLQSQASSDHIATLARHALGLLNREEDPVRWAELKGLLASAVDDIDEAIVHQTDSLTVFTRESYPEHWARGISDLGRQYFAKTSGDRSENIEKAIACYQGALEVFTLAEHPKFWAMDKADLSVLYDKRLMGEPRENRELVLYHVLDTLKVFTPESCPEDYARNCALIGEAYRDRIAGDRRENLQAAVAYYERARAHYAPHENPEECRRMRALLGQAHLLLASHDGSAAEATAAIEHLEAALAGTDRAANPEQWAGDMQNLALARSLLASGSPDIEAEIGRMEESLTSFSTAKSPIQRADIQVNIAMLNSKLIRKVGDQHEQRTTVCLEAAAVLYRETDTQKFRDTQHNLARIFARSKRWLEAHQAYASALDAATTLYDSAFTESGRRHELSDIGMLSSGAAFTLVMLGRSGEALEQLEMGRTFLLRESLAVDAIDPQETADHRPAARSAMAEIRKIEGRMRAAQLPPGEMRKMAEELRQACSSLRTVMQAVRAEGEDDADGPGKLSDGQILELIPEGGAMIVPFRSTGAPSLALVVPHGQKNVSDEDVVPLLEVVGTTPHGIRPLFDPSQAWRGETAESAWKFAAQTLALGSRALDPVVDRLLDLELADGAPLLVLGTPLESLGLHMATYQMGSGLESILRRYTVRYVPSARLLRICQRRIEQRTAADPLLLAVLDPHNDLPASRAETGILEDRFAMRRYLHGGDASLESIRVAASGASYLHFSGHGRYAPEDPRQSGLLLAKGHGMTAAEILSSFDLSSSRLVTLAACESGLTDTEALAAEYIGLPTAFLAAGAPAVLSTLWKVDDAAALLVMDRFYTGHRKFGWSAVKALAAAQCWLRDATNAQVSDAFNNIKARAHPAWSGASEVAQSAGEFHGKQPLGDRPFEQPYYWAPFVLMGADVPGEVTLV